ncbi:histidine phosphatase family protein [Nocardia abscessus]|nr:histidine phosphatase family protein [Nocardia abscessus]
MACRTFTPHAEHTEHDLVGGWYDSKLTARGRRDARRVAEELARRSAASRSNARAAASIRIAVTLVSRHGGAVGPGAAAVVVAGVSAWAQLSS